MSEISFIERVSFSWDEKGKIISFGGLRVNIFNIGCGEKCVTLMEFEMIMPPRGRIEFCGSDIQNLGIQIGKTRILVIHKPCEVKFGSTIYKIPEEISGLPRMLKVRDVTYSFQELGRGARVRTLYNQEPRVYLLITPTHAILRSKDGKKLLIPPEPLLIATPGSSELEITGVTLKLP